LPDWTTRAQPLITSSRGAPSLPAQAFHAWLCCAANGSAAAYTAKKAALRITRNMFDI
jgi:hypothetical protein